MIDLEREARETATGLLEIIPRGHPIPLANLEDEMLSLARRGHAEARREAIQETVETVILAARKLLDPTRAALLDEGGGGGE